MAEKTQSLEALLKKNNQLESTLKEAQKLAIKLDAVLDSSYDGIYITDGEGITLRVNKAYERITGISADALIGRNMAVLVEEGVFSKACSIEVIKTRKVTTIQQKLATGKVVLVTGTPIFDDKGNIEMVVSNVRDITELLDLREALKAKEKAVDLYNSELERLRKRMSQRPEIMTRNVQMQVLMESALRAARHDTTVLISGETGVGKEVMASFIHRNSDRRKKKLVKINCSAIPESLMESEFFGYEKGAFTGASHNGKIGLFEEANEGSIFLDEIGELPINLQSKLLRVLQEQEIQRVGGLSPIKINVRVIAATNRDLEEMANQGLFRKDLYYRLNIIPLHIPALRDRKEDIIPLANDFIDRLNALYGGNKRFSKEAYEALASYEWPGNIRELKNVIERAFVMTDHMLIENMNLPKSSLTSERAKDSKNTEALKSLLKANESLTLKEAMAKLEWQFIEAAERDYANVRDAASALGIDASTFVRKRRKLKEELSLGSED